MKVILISKTENYEDTIVKGAKLCYSKSTTENLVTNKDYLEMLMNIKHYSVLRHSSITFQISGISRACGNQLIRHSVGCSYSQQSQRYVSMDNFDYYENDIIKEDEEMHIYYMNQMELANEAYDYIKKKLINKGYSEKESIEVARDVLPISCSTNIQVTMSTEALLNFFKKRLCNRAQIEIRTLALEMFKICYRISPTIYQYALPSCLLDKCNEGKFCCKKQDEIRKLLLDTMNDIDKDLERN